MAWLARSLANSLNLAGDGAGEDAGSDPSAGDSPRGVKDDLTELSHALSRQFWGVASLLAPPPPPPATVMGPEAAVESGSGGGAIGGIRGDLAEIGGRFRSGISRLSNHQAVAEISKIASSFLSPIEEEEEREEEEAVAQISKIASSFLGPIEEKEEAVGVTEEVLAFAKNISMHPETWLDFPLFLDDEDDDDFDMSDAQQAHAVAVERLSPRLAALRTELCPRHMSEGCFWKTYFVLLHSRLNKHDAELLSTPQIVEARAMLTKELQNRTKPAEADKFGRVGTSNARDPPEGPDGTYNSSKPAEADKFGRVGTSNARDPPEGPDGTYNSLGETKPHAALSGEQGPGTKISDVETEKYPLMASEVKYIDKSVIEEPIIQTSKYGVSSSSVEQNFDEDGDDWLEDNADVAASALPLGNEDVSFSDLEDDDDASRSPSERTVTDASDADASKVSGQWMRLSESRRNSTKESGNVQKGTNDWLNVDINTV